MAVPTIAVIGSLNVDIVSRTSRVPVAGETLITESFNTGSGGKGANQAVACARLSRTQDAVEKGVVNVQMAGAVGDDSFGRDMLANLQKNGVDLSGILTQAGEKTGVAVIIVEVETGENRILMSPNANYTLKPSNFQELKAPLPDLIVMQLEIELETVSQVLRSASRHNVEVLLNPAPAQVLPQEALQLVTHLVVNESEAAIVTGNEGKDIDWQSDSAARQQLLDLGSKHVILTLGSKGGLYFSNSSKEVHAFPAKKVQVRDTTAAGDTFVGAYSVAITVNKRRDLNFMAKAVEWANKAASLTVQREGAQAAIPWRDELAELHLPDL